MRLQYIWHDCFVLNATEFDIVFDFWKDPTVDEGSLPRFLRQRNRERPLYVIVSHHHKDHFNRSIYEWESHFPNVIYIISKDVFRSCRYIFSETSVYAGKKIAKEKLCILEAGESFEDCHVCVRAFGSTDIGNSYLVETEGSRIFHAGDLNAWIWKDESSEKEIMEAIEKFENIVDEIKKQAPCIDIAMFPVDSRIGTDYFTGASRFVRSIDVGHFFPMHFGLGDEKEQERYRLDAAHTELYSNPKRGEYICLQAPYSCFQKSC